MRESDSDTRANEFVSLGRQRPTSLIGDIWRWLRTNKKWWLLPILIMLGLLGLLVLAAGAGAGPFIYPLF